jgi:flagellar motor switch protein FliN/FliY
MSSTSFLPTSLSSSRPAEPSGPAFADVADVPCKILAVLGSGTITVERCLTLERNSVLALDQSAGEDLHMVINGTVIARGEVVIIEDTTALRLTEIAAPVGQETGA